MTEIHITDSNQHQDDIIDKTLRPTLLTDFIGQDSLVENLKLYIEAANKRGILRSRSIFELHGLGRNNPANIVSKELSSNIRHASGPMVEKAGDLAGLITNLEKDVFIDEIHRLNSNVEEYLYSAMEDFTIDIMIDKGQAREAFN